MANVIQYEFGRGRDDFGRVLFLVKWNIEKLGTTTFVFAKLEELETAASISCHRD